ncbi:MAG: phosphate acyltransferase PlsX [Candidatus Hydrogenedentales bacterium]
MRIIVDAMGSDNAPAPEVRGAVDASLATDAEIVLVGDQALLNPALARFKKRGNLAVVHAGERVTMEDSPMVAVRKKKQSSLMVGLRMVKDGEADGFISAGNTGAVMLASRVVLGPIRGVARSAICQILPTSADPVVVLDLGANVDCTARHLCEFAEMGTTFSQAALNVKNPRVGLLNIGEEQIKGNEVAKTVHRTLSNSSHINFIGNVEPKAIFHSQADVVVCDGFVGNIILKTSEAVASLMKTLVERELRATWLSSVGALLSKGAFHRLRKTIDPNEHPGAPLLGVNGTVVILHGSCDARAVRNGILGAKRYVELGLNDRIRDAIATLRQEAPEVVEPVAAAT